jgi:uncharacterized protein
LHRCAVPIIDILSEGNADMAIVAIMRPAYIAAGLIILLAAVPARAAASYAPIECSKAASPSETAICGNYALGQAEARMATLFGVTTSLVGMGQRGDLGDQQRRWITQRDACGADTSCLARAYRTRIDELSAVLDSIVARGPF